ncbi:hypothetical protein D9757_001819 [Collybiopsis confluens]|uniref:Uncharacterized protein n=1 Tax=Collybiopsis confluens TaxID=2823264 RepID=A0A8H5MET7_9AGAR|nr:hypothetical protein D9757_001819 [Collybiopsis confluens]
MFDSAFQSISTIILPKPPFKVPPSEPDLVYYTATVFRNLRYHPQASYSNFNVSAANCETPPERVPNTPASSARKKRRFSLSGRDPTCCFCDNTMSNKIQTPDLELLTAMASSLLESSSYQSTRPPRRKPSSFWSGRSSKSKRLRHKRQETFTSDSKVLRRVSRRVKVESSRPTDIASFDSGSVESPLECLNSARRSSSTHDVESSVSSCSSFDPSDSEGTYPASSLLPLTASDAFPSALELSPIIEDPTTFDDVDNILAYYSGNHLNFAFDEADWEPEPIFDVDQQPEAKRAERSDHSDFQCTRQMSFVLKSTEICDTPYCSTFKDQPSALTLTFPTPEIPGISTFIDAVPLLQRSTHEISQQPQTPPRRPSGNSVNSLLPPTPIPALPRCTVCKFGFAYDVTGSTSMLPGSFENVKPCNKCQDQWNRCRNWYGKRGWDVNSLVHQDMTADPKNTKGFDRTSKRLLSVFRPDRISLRLSDNVQSNTPSRHGPRNKAMFSLPPRFKTTNVVLRLNVVAWRRTGVNLRLPL